MLLNMLDLVLLNGLPVDLDVTFQGVQGFCMRSIKGFLIIKINI